MQDDQNPVQVELEVHDEDAETWALIRLHGALDGMSGTKVSQTIDRLVEEGCTRVALECSDIHFIDSLGLRVLISGHRRLNEVGTFEILNPSPPVDRLLRFTGLDEVCVVIGKRWAGQEE